MTQPDITLLENSFERMKNIPIKYFRGPNFQTYMKAFCVEIDELYKVFYDLRHKTKLTAAEGVNLDYVGQKVGEPRKSNLSPDIDMFTFRDNAFGKGFNDGKFFSLSSSSVGQVIVRDDDIYRRYIRAKIILNSTSMGNKDLQNIIKIIMDDDNVVYEYDATSPATINIYYTIILTGVEKAIYRGYLDRCMPVGCRLNLFESVILDEDGNIILDEDGNYIFGDE